MKRIFSLAFLVTVVALGGIVVFGQNYKIKQTTSMAGGHQMTSTVYVKGSRKRTESGGMMGMSNDVATIEQCDLGRTVQVNDKKKMYYVVENRGPATAGTPTTRTTAPKATKGGTITQTSNITDTGERKQMFGLTARHIKTSMTMTSSPEACNQTNMSMQTDGWYVDLPLFSCPAPVPGGQYYGQGVKTGCQDTFVTKSTGSGKLGFALEMTQTMNSGGETSFSQTISTLEFSKATLDDALFNVPADYKLVASSQELYGTPDLSQMMSGQQAQTTASVDTATDRVKKPGTVRIGVLVPSNRSGENLISPVGLQAFLVKNLTGGRVEGFAVTSEDEARKAECDYLLSTDISKLKQSTAAKIGGMFGRVTGTPTAGTYDAQAEYTLVSLADGKNALKNKAANKTETNPQRAAESVLAIEAQAVMALASK